jgi:hypothetical protein
MKIFLKFDEQQDAVFSLRMLNELLEKIPQDDQYWKWVIIALHSALQGFMVLACQGPDKLAIISDYKGAQQKTQCYFRQVLGYDTETEINLPDLGLKKFSQLYDCIKLPEIMERSDGARTFIPEERHDTSVKELNEIRGNFIHFFPKSRFEDPMDFVRIANDCIEVISFLVSESYAIAWYRLDLENQTELLISEITSKLNKLKIHYSTLATKTETR